MQALVVVEVDVAADRFAKRVVAVEGAVVVHVRLHRLVPGLHVRVVVHPARAIGRLLQACAHEAALEVACQELDPPIAVQQRVATRTACPQGGPERPPGQGCGALCAQLSGVLHFAC